MQASKRKQPHAAVQVYLVQKSAEYGASIARGRTQQHALLEQFVSACRGGVPAGLREGAFGKPKLLLRTLERFGPCGLQEEVLAAVREGARPAFDAQLLATWRETLRSRLPEIKQEAALLNFQHVHEAFQVLCPGGDVSGLEVRTAARFCVVHGAVVQARVAMLTAVGFCCGERFEREVQEFRCDYQAAKSAAASVFKEKRMRDRVLPLYFAVRDKIGRYPWQRSDDQIQTALQSLSRDRAAVRRLLAELHRREASSSSPPPTPSPPPPAPPPRAWHESLCEEMRDFAEHNVARTAYPRSLLKMTMVNFRRLLALLERYAAETNFQSLEKFFAEATVADVRLSLQFAARQCTVRNDRVKNARQGHHARRFVESAVRWIRLLRHRWGCAGALDQLTVMDILRGVPNRRIPADPTVRRIYTNEEQEKMQAMALGPAEALMITLLTHVGLRAGAIANMKYETLLNPDHSPRLVCKILEKGRQTRIFHPPDVVRTRARILSDYLRTQHDEDALRGCYLLNLRNIRQPLSVHTVERVVQAIGERAGVEGVRVLPHSFRHTLVTKLLKVGNSLDTVSKWIGHADVSTTASFYWLPNTSDLSMIDPFSSSSTSTREHTPEDLSLLQTKLRACRAVIDTYQRNADPGTHSKVRAEMPHLDALLRAVDTSAGARHDVPEGEKEQEETFAR